MWRAPYIVVCTVLAVGLIWLGIRIHLFPSASDSDAPAALASPAAPRALKDTPPPEDQEPSRAGSRPAQKDLDSQLVAAAQVGELARVQALLKQGADPNTHHGAYMAVVADHGHNEVLQALIKTGGHADCSTLFGAVTSENMEMVRFLLQEGIKPDQGQCSALRAAVESGQPEMARILLAAGADIHHRIEANDKSDEPIEIARRNGGAAMQRLLQGAH